MKVFFTADTHFGDSNIIRYENRPFSDIEDMDRTIIKNWNDAVSLGLPAGRLPLYAAAPAQAGAA